MYSVWTAPFGFAQGKLLKPCPTPKHALTETIDSIRPSKVTARLAGCALQFVRDHAEVTR